MEGKDEAIIVVVGVVTAGIDVGVDVGVVVGGIIVAKEGVTWFVFGRFDDVVVDVLFEDG